MIVKKNGNLSKYYWVFYRLLNKYINLTQKYTVHSKVTSVITINKQVKTIEPKRVQKSEVSSVIMKKEISNASNKASLQWKEMNVASLTIYYNSSRHLFGELRVTNTIKQSCPRHHPVVYMIFYYIFKVKLSDKKHWSSIERRSVDVYDPSDFNDVWIEMLQRWVTVDNVLPCDSLTSVCV